MNCMHKHLIFFFTIFFKDRLHARSFFDIKIYWIVLLPWMNHWNEMNNNKLPYLKRIMTNFDDIQSIMFSYGHLWMIADIYLHLLGWILLNILIVCFIKVWIFLFKYKRQSTDGLSILMFWLAIFGNLTYGLAILVRELDSVYVIRHVPWLVGSLGVILLDASVSFKTFEPCIVVVHVLWNH